MRARNQITVAEVLTHLQLCPDGAPEQGYFRRVRGQFAGKYAGSVNTIGYRQIMIAGRAYLEHRLVFLVVNGYLPDTVDHENGNTLDNRSSNLRAASNKQNTRNKRKSKSNTSGYKGVTWNKRRAKWFAQIKVDGVTKGLGLFDDPRLAAEAYDTASVKYFNNFAKCNF